MLFILKLFLFIYLYKVSTFAENIQVIINLEPKYYDLNEVKKLFSEFVKTFHKEYRNKKEYNYRLRVFKKTLKEINIMNVGSSGEVYGITEFSDLTLEESVNEHSGFKDGVLPNNTIDADVEAEQYVEVTNVPDEWDWRLKGVVTPVRHQMSCHSCWSFTAAGCVESQYAIKHGILLTLSDQQMLDCYKKTCLVGDWPHNAMNAASQMGGYMLGQEYPYTGDVGMCNFEPSRAFVKVNSGRMYQIRNEEELKKLVYNYGPVVVGINAAGYGFFSYRGGIATVYKLGCEPNAKINHSVILVGYGTENGVPYWIIKNTAGSQWGEAGYMRLIRGVNACRILDYTAIADVP